MTGNRCVHGMDGRFCAVCNRASRSARASGAIGSVDLAEILRFLNQEEIRATYAAVGEVLGIVPRAMGGQLGPHTAERSWIVSAGSGLPTDYSPEDLHPSLQRTDEIIRTGTELIMRMTAWRGTSNADG
jgi:hypothetical protein